MKVLRFYVLCPVALKMKNIPSVVKSNGKNKGKVNKQLSGCSSHLLVGKGMCHLAPSSCTTNESTSLCFLATGKIVAENLRKHLVLAICRLYGWFLGGSTSFLRPSRTWVCVRTDSLSQSG